MKITTEEKDSGFFISCGREHGRPVLSSRKYLETPVKITCKGCASMKSRKGWAWYHSGCEITYIPKYDDTETIMLMFSGSTRMWNT